MYFGQVAATVADVKSRTGAPDSDFELDTRALALLGRSITASDYVTARKKWNDYSRALGRFHERFDLYLTPTAAQPPAKIGELTMPAREQTLVRSVIRLGLGKALIKSGIVDKLAQKSLERTPFTQLPNLTGTPSMSVPLHFADLPYGVQFVARFGDEALLLRLASQLEKERPWWNQRPKLG
jgi:amidase